MLPQERKLITMSTKLTKRDHFNALRALASASNRSDLVNFIDHELDLLARKNAGDRKETATQKANADLKEKILDVMVADTRYTITELGKLVGVESNQKVSALVRQLKMDNLVIRSEEKGKAYFTKA